MAPLKPLLRRLLDTGTTEVLYECRDCGTSVDDERESCPHCGSDSVACHRLN